jgi:CDGSH-type Zn-finger protein
MDNGAVVAGRAPLGLEVEAGKDYFWCACGKSSKQPFCDGSHKGSSFSPMKWTAPETKKAFFCLCKQTESAPLCNGAHKNLPT